MKKVVFLALLFIIASCAEQNPLDGFQLFSGNNDTKVISMDSVIEKASVVLLDTSARAPLLGEISFVYESQGSYYMISGDTAVFEYDKTGSFIRKIGAEGRGPGEYLGARSLYFQDTLFVFDFPSQKIIQYDKNGNYLKFRKLECDSPNLHFKSFFVSQDNLIFYALNNSSSMSLYEYQNGELSPISQQNRTMLPGEALMGGPVSFGAPDQPYLYNENFNDTVYIVKEHRLIPSFLIKIGNYRYSYTELDYEKVISSSLQKVQTEWIVAAGDYLFISYQVSNLSTKNDGKFMGVYNFATKEYFQNVEFANPPSEYTDIRFDEKLYQGYNPNEVFSIRLLNDSEASYAIVKYTVK